jgi:hypothetical protein
MRVLLFLRDVGGRLEYQITPTLTLLEKTRRKTHSQTKTRSTLERLYNSIMSLNPSCEPVDVRRKGRNKQNFDLALAAVGALPLLLLSRPLDTFDDGF